MENLLVEGRVVRLEHPPLVSKDQSQVLNKAMVEDSLAGKFCTGITNLSLLNSALFLHLLHSLLESSKD